MHNCHDPLIIQCVPLSLLVRKWKYISWNCYTTQTYEILPYYLIFCFLFYAMFTTNLMFMSWEFLQSLSPDMLERHNACKLHNYYLPWRSDLCTFGYCIVSNIVCPALTASVSSVTPTWWAFFVWNRRIKVRGIKFQSFHRWCRIAESWIQKLGQ